MKKRDEIADPNSCFNKAKDDEVIFVLREKDDAFYATVMRWIAARIELGLNKADDAKLESARQMLREVLEKKYAMVGDQPYKMEEGDWGILPLEPCRYCFEIGGVQFMIDNGSQTNLSPIRCDKCKRSWLPEGK